MRVQFIIEWLLMALLLPAALLWLAPRPGLEQLDAAIYDRMLMLTPHAPSPDILIVAIDDRSIDELGRWPWPRDVHARLFERLAADAPKAVLFDLFLTEPSRDAQEDERLAQAMGRLPVYLPLLHASPAAPGSNEWSDFRPALPIFAAQARGIGHVNVTPDTDGVVRTLYLREGYAGRLESYVGALLANGLAPAEGDAPSPMGTWLQEAPLRLRFAGPAGSYRTVSYASVLRGEVPAELLRGKLLLVGATAPGLGDHVLTPSVGRGGALPGIELHANAIDSLLHGWKVNVPAFPIHAAWVVLPIWLALWLLIRMAHHALPIALGLATACLALSGFAMLARHWWLPPAAPVLGLFMLYLLWSWQRLESQFVYFRQRAQALDAVPAGAFEHLPTPATKYAGQEPKQALDRAIARLRRMQALMDEALHAMPVAVLICDNDGRIGASNAGARRLLGEAARLESDGGVSALAGRSLPALIGSLPAAPMENRPMAHGRVAAADADADAHWTVRLCGEYVTAGARVFHLEAAAFGAALTGDLGWVIVLPELTAEREAQRQRDKWRRFLSHDLRSPQVTILSLLSMHEASGDTAALVRAIQREAERTLKLAEGFMDVTEAESDAYRFAATHMGSVLLDARDQVWPYAEANDVQIDARLDGAEDAVIQADGALLTRAIVNLLNNAIRHSPPGGRISLCLAAVPGVQDALGEAVAIAIGDEGSGMSEDQLHALLAGALRPRVEQDVMEAAARPPGRAAPAMRGMGLGFAVVRAVVQRHRGRIDAASAPGAGSTFWVTLPVR
jgi:CHASE2 domain-containing sensor protein/signal transduction histidine kinase